LAITLIKAVIEDMMRELPRWKRQRSLRSTAPSSPPEFQTDPIGQLTRANFHASTHGVMKSPNRART
jgi:hypothetical protein